MNDFVQFPPAPSPESLAMVGFRLDPEHDGPQFYSLFAMEGGNDRPLARNGRILFFRSPEQAAQALTSTDDEAAKKLAPVPKAMDLYCDVAQALYVANAARKDEDGALLDAIACLDDLMRATQINVPAEYANVLASVSEHLLESAEVSAWMKQQKLGREHLEDALMWCVGAVAMKASWVE